MFCLVRNSKVVRDRLTGTLLKCKMPFLTLHLEMVPTTLLFFIHFWPYSLMWRLVQFLRVSFWATLEASNQNPVWLSFHEAIFILAEVKNRRGNRFSPFLRARGTSGRSYGDTKLHAVRLTELEPRTKRRPWLIIFQCPDQSCHRILLHCSVVKKDWRAIVL